MKLVIGNKNYSSWSLRPWLLLAHHKIPFEEERIPLFSQGYKELLAAHGGIGLVPVLLDDSVTVWDSLAICEYVSEKYLDGAGWPADQNARAKARACSAEMHSGFNNIRNTMPMNVRAKGRRIEVTPAIEAEIQRIDVLWSELLLSGVGQEGPWLFGEFSIADCMYAPMTFRFNTYGIELSGKAKGYSDFVLNDPDMQVWLAGATAETETIDFAEQGL